MAEEQTVITEPKVGEVLFPLKTILGQKVGMTRIFSELGESIPVSVIFVGSCVTTQVKTQAKDGYNAVQLGVGECKEKSLSKPYRAQFQKRNLVPLRELKEFRVNDPKNFHVGQKVSAEIFSAGDYVDVSGTSKGKGFASVMKRHNFSGSPTSHGASDKVRARGSSAGGSGAPQRVYKGTKMAGRMGSDWVTTQKLEVVKVDKENQLLLIKGAIPGVSRSFVVVKETTKRLKHKSMNSAVKSSKKAAPKKAAKPAEKAKK